MSTVVLCTLSFKSVLRLPAAELLGAAEHKLTDVHVLVVGTGRFGVSQSPAPSSRPPPRAAPHSANSLRVEEDPIREPEAAARVVDALDLPVLHDFELGRRRSGLPGQAEERGAEGEDAVCHVIVTGQAGRVGRLAGESGGGGDRRGASMHPLVCPWSRTPSRVRLCTPPAPGNRKPRKKKRKKAEVTWEPSTTSLASPLVSRPASMVKIGPITIKPQGMQAFR